MDTKRDDIRARALTDLRRFQVVMDGHFDYGNGYHGRLYLNPHQLFRYPSTIWRVAQDLIDVLPPGVAEKTTVVAGPATGGALLAHTIAGLLDGRRPLSREPYSFAPLQHAADGSPASKLPWMLYCKKEKPADAGFIVGLFTIWACSFSGSPWLFMFAGKRRILSTSIWRPWGRLLLRCFISTLGL